MATVAEHLRQGRANRNLTVYDVAEATKIRTDHVRALEEGNYRVFAAPVYIRGFVRTYSKLLKLDTEAVLKQLEAEIGNEDTISSRPPVSGQASGSLDAILLQISKLPLIWMAALAGVALAALIGFAAWRVWDRYQSHDPVAGLGPEVYNPPRTNRGEYLQLPQNPPGR